MCLFPVFNRPRAEVQDQGRETESRGEGAGGEIHNRGGEKRPHSSASAGFKKGTGGASAAAMSRTAAISACTSHTLTGGWKQCMQ